jgi:hypothetical protein
LEDAKLAERAREGDTAAYEWLVRMHQAVTFRAAYLVTGDASEAEDPQEAFVKAYRALGRFRPGAPFRPWLLAIVSNEASAEAGATGCPAPSLEAEPTRAASGATFRIRGSGFSSGYTKIGPAQDVRVHFRQNEKTWTLATVDAYRELTFDARLRVPAGARTGAATVSATARPGEQAEERFVVLQR